MMILCCRYVESNVRCLSIMRAYDSKVPAYLHNRPSDFVRHCMRRLPPTIDEIRADAITQADEETFTVQSGQTQYIVKVSSPVPSCSCVDYDRHYLPCKHMLSIMQHHGWNIIPQSYRQFPLFILDEQVVGCTAEQPELVSVDTVTSQQGTSAEVETDTGLTNVARLQSQLRQTVAHLSSMSYDLQDEQLLSGMIARVQQEVNLGKRTLGMRTFPQRYRRRVAKRNARESYLRRRLNAMKRRRYAKKVATKQRRRSRGNKSAVVKCSRMLTVYDVVQLTDYCDDLQR